jgi:glycosyltransferase involved in cell wall biosynthesis
MRARTSFPSKIIDYCQFGKPIIIWGPEYCSAVRWAKQYQSALVVSSPRAEELVKAINTLMDQPAEQERLSHKAIEMAQTIFNPTKIQEQFVDEITRLRSRKTNDC